MWLDLLLPLLTMDSALPTLLRLAWPSPAVNSRPRPRKPLARNTFLGNWSSPQNCPELRAGDEGQSGSLWLIANLGVRGRAGREGRDPTGLA